MKATICFNCHPKLKALVEELARREFRTTTGFLLNAIRYYTMKHYKGTEDLFDEFQKGEFLFPESTESVEEEPAAQKGKKKSTRSRK